MPQIFLHGLNNNSEEFIVLHLKEKCGFQDVVLSCAAHLGFHALSLNFFY